MARLLRLSWVLFCLCLIPLAGCSDGGTFSQEGIRVTGVTLEERPGGARILRGTVENRSDKDLSIVQIQFSLYDADNRRVDAMGVVVRSVPAGGQASFREAVQSDFDIRGVKPRAVLIP